MGKIRNKKNVHHTSAPKYLDEKHEKNDMDIVPIQQVHILQSPQTNIFKNVTISSDMLQQKLPEERVERMSRHSCNIHSKIWKRRKALAPSLLKTDEMDEFKALLCVQRKLRKQNRDSINAVLQTALERAREKNLDRKKKANCLENMDSLVDALPVVSNSKTSQNEAKGKPRVSKPFKTQSKEMLDDMKAYRAALQYSALQAESLEAISARIKKHLEDRLGGAL